MLSYFITEQGNFGETKIRNKRQENMFRLLYYRFEVRTVESSIPINFRTNGYEPSEVRHGQREYLTKVLLSNRDLNQGLLSGESVSYCSAWEGIFISTTKSILKQYRHRTFKLKNKNQMNRHTSMMWMSCFRMRQYLYVMTVIIRSRSSACVCAYVTRGTWFSRAENSLSLVLSSKV